MNIIISEEVVNRVRRGRTLSNIQHHGQTSQQQKKNKTSEGKSGQYYATQIKRRQSTVQNAAEITSKTSRFLIRMKLVTFDTILVELQRPKTTVNFTIQCLQHEGKLKAARLSFSRTQQEQTAGSTQEVLNKHT